MSWQQPYNPGYGGQQPPPRSSAPPPSYNPAYSTQSLPPRGNAQPYSQAQPQWQQQQQPTGYGSPSGGPGYSGTPTYSQGQSQWQQQPRTQSVGAGMGYGSPQGGAGYGGASTGGTAYGAGRPPGGGVPQGVDPELYSWFQAVDNDHSGKITAIELRQALLNSNWSHFNAETCRILIGMFDRDGDGTIDVHEFAALWKYVKEWKSCFASFDKDGSGNIDAHELQQALLSFGYRLSLEFCNLCTRVFDRTDKRTMKFDDFIQCCVMLRSLTDSFKRLDTNKSGVVNINYEQFLEMAVDNTIQ